MVLNHNETHKYDNLVSLTPVSSGFHIGSSNWNLEVGQMKFALITNASFGVDYRHPMPFNGAPLKNADCMVISSVVFQANRPSFDAQIKNLLDKLTQCLDSSLNAKVLMPISPHFVLEIVDILLHKLYDQVKIVFMSESALPLIEYSNINLGYLNPMLQGKIYNTENPLSFDKLISSGRLVVFKDIQEYLNSKKGTHQGMDGPLFNEYERELLLCSHQSLRLGDAVYWLHNFNKHSPASSSLILTDPYTINNELLLKPFTNNLKVHYCPINPSVNFKDLSTIVNALTPKHIISPYSCVNNAVIQSAQGLQPGMEHEENKTELDYGTHHGLRLGFTQCVVDQISSGQVVELTE